MHRHGMMPKLIISEMALGATQMAKVLGQFLRRCEESDLLQSSEEIGQAHRLISMAVLTSSGPRIS